MMTILVNGSGGGCGGKMNMMFVTAMIKMVEDNCEYLSINV